MMEIGIDVSDKGRAHKLSSLFFLIGCALIPEFNDFPMLKEFTSSFRSPSQILFLLATVTLVLEIFIRMKLCSYIKRSHLLFVGGSIFFVWLSFVLNFEQSAYLVDGYGHERMLKVALSTSLKLIMILTFVYLINDIEPGRLAKYVRFGFLVSFTYVVFEVFTIVLPEYLGWVRFDFVDTIESIFHVRSRTEGIAISSERARGLAFEPSYQAIALIFVLPFLVGRKIYLSAWLFSMAFTVSLTGLAATFVFFACYKLQNWKLVLIYLLVLLAVMFVAMILMSYFIIPWGSMGSTVTRAGSWLSAVNGILDNLWFGVGPGMRGYWIVHYYTDFFWTSWEAPIWYASGLETFNAPTFSSLLSIMFDYGVTPILFITIYFISTSTFRYIIYTPIVRASTAAMLVASFGLDMYLFLGFWVFLALILTKKWHLLILPEKGGSIMLRSFRC